jgi:hypothetical protein
MYSYFSCCSFEVLSTLAPLEVRLGTLQLMYYVVSMLKDISKWYSMAKCCVIQTLDLTLRENLTVKVIDVDLRDFLIIPI